METLPLELLLFLGVLEFALVALVAAVVLLLRGNRLARRVRSLRRQLSEMSQQQEAPGFAQYLRDEILLNQELIERAAASQDDSEKKAAELLAMRKQFLELELSARDAQNNPVQFQDTLAAGISELIEQLRPQPDTVTETVTETEPGAGEIEAAQAAPAAPASEASPGRDTHEEELDHLKQVINNQHDAMTALRARLKDSEGELENVDAILARLDEFERQSAELQRCLQVLESENARLKQASDDGQLAEIDPSDMESQRMGSLKSMVDQQQDTITNLHKLIRELAPEAGKARELEEALAGIQRCNEELTGCVAVLEDENNMLRAELEEVTAHIEQQQAGTGMSTGPAGEGGDNRGLEEEKRELENKVTELEALLEFKDAAIEELEKQYSGLEAKYLAATGQKKVD